MYLEGLALALATPDAENQRHLHDSSRQWKSDRGCLRQAGPGKARGVTKHKISQQGCVVYLDLGEVHEVLGDVDGQLVQEGYADVVVILHIGCFDG